jgi:hypothetical protein
MNLKVGNVVEVTIDWRLCGLHQVKITNTYQHWLINNLK